MLSLISHGGTIVIGFEKREKWWQKTFCRWQSLSFQWIK